MPSNEFNKHRVLILNHIKKYGSITQLEATENYGCTRLGARIWDLRHKYGLDIETVNVHGRNKYGRKVTYAKYILNEETTKEA